MWSRAEGGTGQDREGWDTEGAADLASLSAEDDFIRLPLGTDE